MSKTNLPGFTAEASLYRTNTSYQSAAKAYGSGEQQIISQLSWGDIWDGLKSLGETLLHAGCKAACATAGGAITAGCVTGSEGTALPECIAAGAAITSTCQELC
jgi:hypothetical protein